MAVPIYKQFMRMRTVFCLLCAGLFLMITTPVQAETNPSYTVEGVEVDVTAKNAVMAREKALEEAQVKAYGMLVERFLGEEGAKTFAMPDADTISTLVQDFEVTNEQLSKVRYKGIYTVRFRPNAMKSQMASQGQSYSDVAKKPVLVLPFYQSGNQTLLWSQQNPWMQAWRMLPSDKSMMQPTVLPLGDAQDVASVSDSEALEYDPVSVQELAARYNADDIAILLATTEPTNTAQGRVVVNIYNNGFEGPTFVQKIIFDQLPAETPDALYIRAALKVKSILRQNWKANAAFNPQAQVQPSMNDPAPRTAAPIPYTRQALGPTTQYIATARFSSVQDWVRMKNTIDRVYGVQAVIIKSLKQREATMDIRFAGNISALQVALQNAGITMRAGSAGGPIELYLLAQQPVYRQ